MTVRDVTVGYGTVTVQGVTVQYGTIQHSTAVVIAVLQSVAQSPRYMDAWLHGFMNIPGINILDLWMDGGMNSSLLPLEVFQHTRFALGRWTLPASVS